MSRGNQLRAFAVLLAGVLFGAAPWAERTIGAAVSGPAEDAVYASPIELLFSPGGERLYVLCQESGEVRVLDASTFATIATVTVGRVPRGFSLSSDGTKLFVANSWDDTVSVVDTRLLQVTATWPVGAEPSAVTLDSAGKFLFVANRISNDVAVLNARTGAEEKRLAAGRGASYITVAPGGKHIYVTHIYPNLPAQSNVLGNRTPPESEITVIDTSRAVVTERISLHSIAGVFHVAFSADGRLGAVAELHPKNLVPLAHLEHGSAFVDTLTLFGADVGPRTVEVPLDELERFAARPFGVAITPDKSRLYVTSSGSEMVIGIDIPRLLNAVHSRRESLTEDLSASAGYVVARIAVGHDPRGALVAPDGRRLYVANRLDDSISVIDTRTNRLITSIHLAGPDKLSVSRRGEQAFYTARYSFQGQIGCASCHIDSTFDALTWDLEPDGFGRDIVENRNLEDVKDTEPFKWNGGNPNLTTECGPRTEKYFWRAESFSDMTLTDLVMYIRTLPSRPNRWRSSDNQLTPEQERGKAIFERAEDKFDKPIAESNRCSYCHGGAKGTNQKSFDVGTKTPTDNSGVLDTPHLTNVALIAPYLHDGSAGTLEEIWTVYNPDDKHGRTNDLTKDELNDLIEYLRTR
jgi:YVTN family beta-propeller protein